MYNQEGDLQHLGFLSIFKESFKLIFKWHKIFIKITLALIFPLSLSEILISTFRINNTIPNIFTLFNSSTQLEWNIYWLVVYAIYCIFSFVFTLFSISVVAYIVGCIYTNKDITFKNIISVISKALKRLTITYMCVYCTMFGYTFALLLPLGIIIYYFSFKFGGEQVELTIIIFGIIGIILAMMGIIYMSIIWQFANIISVLETTCGFQAMTKSKALIKGKMGTAIGMYLVWIICSVPTYFLSNHLNMTNERANVEFGEEKIWFIIIDVVWFTFLDLLNYVVQTVFYLVCCKSYHGENVEKAWILADHLEVYDADYVPLNSKVAQVGGLDVQHDVI